MTRPLLFQLLLYHISQCAIETTYRMVKVPNNQFCRLHMLNAATTLECGALCQLKENNGICTAYAFDTKLANSCQCGQAPCFDESYATDVSPKIVLVNDKCDGETCGLKEFQS